MTTTSPYATMADVRAANEKAGQHWFSPNTMAFFNSVVETQLYRGRYFVTSERRDDPDDPRMFTVRRAEDDADISTVGEFMGHATLTSALDAMWEAINAEAGTS